MDNLNKVGLAMFWVMMDFYIKLLKTEWEINQQPSAFDTIDHNILLDRLEHSLGFTGTALTWLQSYLTGRSQFVKLGNHKSTPTPVYHWCPDNLESCLSDFYYWCCLNSLALNPDKTDSILFGTRQRANSYLDITTVNVADTKLLHWKKR